MNSSSSWIEPPPHQRGLGCFAKGCLILLVLGFLLCLAFVAGTYYAAKFVRTSEYFSTEHTLLPISHASVDEENAIRARWNAFDKAARAHEPARIELSADDINALIATDSTVRGDAYVTIEDNVAHLQVSIPIGQRWWMPGRYLNAQCSVESAASGKPEDARITSIIVNGRPVGEEFLNWQYGVWSIKRYVGQWTGEANIKTFEISGGKVILETNAPSEDPFSAGSPAPSSTPTLQLAISPTPTPEQ